MPDTLDRGYGSHGWNEDADMNERLLRQTVPVVINSFNQPTYLMRMVASLVAHDFRTIWIVDQASTTHETQECLALLETSTRCRIFRVRENRGPHWFFGSELFDAVGNLFVYTDADLALTARLPSNFLQRLRELTIKYQVGKAGCALAIADSDDFVERTTTFQGQDYSIRQWEQRFWTRPLEADVYDAIVDTTFAMYNKAFFKRSSFLKAVRVADGWTARHLPWYRDKRVGQTEWAAYEASCRHSHWFNSASERPTEAGNEEHL